MRNGRAQSVQHIQTEHDIEQHSKQESFGKVLLALLRAFNVRNERRIDKFKEDGGGSLVFKVDPCNLYPLFIDIDVRLKTMPASTVDVVKCYDELISMILGIFSDKFP